MTNKDETDLKTLSGRLAYAIRSIGPSHVAKNTSLSLAQVSRLSRQMTSTTLENAADISQATGFLLHWIALGEGPMKVDAEVWEQTNAFKKVGALDDSQKINMSFDSEFLEKDLNVAIENCRIWEVDYKISLNELERGFTLLLNTANSNTAGRFVIEMKGAYKVADIQTFIDGSYSIELDKDVKQTITQDQYEKLNIIGEVIWHGGQS